MQRLDHLRLLAVFHLVYGGILLFGAFFVPSLQRGFGWGTGLGFWGMSFVAILAVLGVLHLAAGVGLPRQWGRFVSIVAAVASLPSVPFGTALGIYALVVHFAKERFDEVPG